MTAPIDLDAVQARIDAATESEWHIAHARTDLPHAVEILRELREMALDEDEEFPREPLYDLRDAVLRLTGG